MMIPMDAMKWYAATVGDDTPNAVAAKSGLVYTTLYRQLSTRKLTPETIVGIARAYGRDAINALVAHGLLTEDDVRMHGSIPALSSATDTEIAEEVYRRLVESAATDELTDGQVIELHKNVTDDSKDAGYEQYAAGQTRDPVDTDFPD